VAAADQVAGDKAGQLSGATPVKPESRYATSLGREVHYMEWGEAAAPVVLMWHGFSRTGRDFDYLAERMALRWRVLCPDTIGCGLSDWSPEPAAEYSVAFYARLAAGLLDAIGVPQCAWVGTSMGGRVGILAAAGPLAGRITRLVLNDVGPEQPFSETKRIAAYISNPPTFDSVRGIEKFMRTQYKAMGEMTDAQWRWRAESSARRLPDGRFSLHYDPRIAAELVNRPPDYNIWPQWDSLRCPVLVLRGVQSTVLTEETALGMTQRGPRARLERLEGCGHPPALNTPERAALIEEFIAADPARA